VYLGSFPKSAEQIIRTCYPRGGLESIGPGQIETGDVAGFSSLGELLDRLSFGAERHQVIINHGRATDGLLIKFHQHSPYNATGGVIGPLADLADPGSRGQIAAGTQSVVDVAAKMGPSFRCN
jgi:hypothetical protein